MAHGSRNKKKKIESKLIHYLILCGHCNTEFTTPGDAYLYVVAQDCDVCGSHGEVELSVMCTNCKKNSEIIIKEW